MGKNSKSRRSSKSLSRHSMLSIKKRDQLTKIQSRAVKKKVKTLFENLRSEGDSSASLSLVDNTVIEVDGAENKSVSRNTRDSTSHFIVVGDDDDLIINSEPCPIQCSTPLANSKHSLNIVNSLVNNNSSSAQNFQHDVEDLTKEINGDSYLTIDLTTESGLNATRQSQFNTVIDLVNNSNQQDCTVTNDSLSMSGDSDVTVINTKRSKSKVNHAQMRNFAKGIANMNVRERGKLLEFIAQKLLNGCSRPCSRNISLHSLKNGVSCATETVEDTYIKEVILGQAISRNSIGSNIYNPERDIKNKTGLRMIVIDGSNVAMQHSKGRVFSVNALKICIDYFLQRGHVTKAFVPRFRCKLGKSTDGKLLDSLERQGHVVYTPSREIQGRLVTSYDDRYIVQCAAEFDGVIVSGDNYRDLLLENPRWRHVIENRLLQFTWVGDMIMFPRDPLGRNGPTLEQFLKHPS